MISVPAEALKPACVRKLTTLSLGISHSTALKPAALILVLDIEWKFCFPHKGNCLHCHYPLVSVEL